MSMATASVVMGLFRGVGSYRGHPTWPSWAICIARLSLIRSQIVPLGAPCDFFGATLVLRQLWADQCRDRTIVMIGADNRNDDHNGLQPEGADDPFQEFGQWSAP